jgi:hypothetical protein
MYSSMHSTMPPRERGSSAHNPADPLCEERVDDDWPGEDFGQVCPVCHPRSEARHISTTLVRETGS